MKLKIKAKDIIDPKVVKERLSGAKITLSSAHFYTSHKDDIEIGTGASDGLSLELRPSGNFFLIDKRRNISATINPLKLALSDDASTLLITTASGKWYIEIKSIIK